MSELLKALQGLPPAPKKVHTVTIEGQSLVVTLEKKLEVMKNGEDAYTWKSPTEIILKPKTKCCRSRQVFLIICILQLNAEKFWAGVTGAVSLFRLSSLAISGRGAKGLECQRLVCLISWNY